MDSRRTFLKSIFLFSGLLSSCKKEEILHLEESLLSHDFDQKIILKKDSKLLFIGDSITDADRDKNVLIPNEEEGLGRGYVKSIATELLMKEQFAGVSIYNRGIGGNTIGDLLNRWNNDVIALKPDALSILIGVNDVRKLVAPTTYYKTYQQILSETKDILPDTSIILCEPFILSNIIGYNNNLAYNFHEYRKVIRKLAIDFNTFFVSNYLAFESRAATVAAANLLIDGVHPTDAGIEILKNQWLKACKF